jgi:hypothetical protein
MFGLAIVMTAIHMIVMLMFFRYETPKYSLFISKDEIELQKTLSE